jgi:hypothetical protein
VAVFRPTTFHQFVEILDYLLIEEVDLRSLLMFQLVVTCDRAKQTAERVECRPALEDRVRINAT